MSIKAWLAGMVIGQGSPQLERYGVKEVTSIEQLENAFSESAETPLFLFKHSTRCPISAAAHRRVADYLQAHPEDAPPFYLLKVIESRPVSTEAAARLGVTHQSPQLILIRNGIAVWSASHGAITMDAIRGALAEK